MYIEYWTGKVWLFAFFGPDSDIVPRCAWLERTDCCWMVPGTVDPEER